MIFEKGWFLHKMNKYAPRGYKFVALGDEGRIAIQSTEIMGNQKPSGPFVSNISFDLLDTVYGGLLTKRGHNICQGATLGEYLMQYEIAKPYILPTDNKNAEYINGKYKSCLEIVREHTNGINGILPIFMHKNALLIQGMIDAQAVLPNKLTERLNTYVNKRTWKAIEKVFNTMLICDMKFYQEEYRKKMQALGIEYDSKSGIVLNEEVSKAKRYEKISAELETLQYDVLPRQQKSVERAKAKNPADEAAQERAAARLAQTDADIQAKQQERATLAPTPVHRPARTSLYTTFHSHGQPVTPKIPQNSFGQMVFLMLLRKQKAKQK